MFKKATFSLGFVAFAAFGFAQSFTVATFDDPSKTSTNPLFAFSGGSNGTGGLSGSWGFAPGAITGLTLRISTPASLAMGLSTTYNDAKFTYDNGTDNSSVQYTNGVMNASQNGRVRFYDSAGAEVFRIRFGGSFYSPLTAGSAWIFSHNVDFQNPAGTSYGFTNQSFSFAFANQAQLGNGSSATSSFTSSAVPEPITLGLLALGAAGVAARRRNRR